MFSMLEYQYFHTLCSMIHNSDVYSYDGGFIDQATGTWSVAIQTPYLRRYLNLFIIAERSLGNESMFIRDIRVLLDQLERYRKQGDSCGDTNPGS